MQLIIDRRLNDLVRDPLEVEDLASGVHDRVADLGGPDVLPHQERRGRVRIELLGEVPFDKKLGHGWLLYRPV